MDSCNNDCHSNVTAAVCDNVSLETIQKHVLCCTVAQQYQCCSTFVEGTGTIQALGQALFLVVLSILIKNPYTSTCLHLDNICSSNVACIRYEGCDVAHSVRLVKFFAHFQPFAV